MITQYHLRLCFILFILLSHCSFCCCQPITNNNTVTTSTCIQYLVESDIDSNLQLDRTEYLLFLQRSSNTQCNNTSSNATSLNSYQLSEFDMLACMCQLDAVENNTNCCLYDIASISIHGIDSTATSFKDQFILSYLCNNSTNNAIVNACPVPEAATPTTTNPTSISPTTIQPSIGSNIILTQQPTMTPSSQPIQQQQPSSSSPVLAVPQPVVITATPDGAGEDTTTVVTNTPTVTTTTAIPSMTTAPPMQVVSNPVIEPTTMTNAPVITPSSSLLVPQPLPSTSTTSNAPIIPQPIAAATSALPTLVINDIINAPAPTTEDGEGNKMYDDSTGAPSSIVDIDPGLIVEPDTPVSSSPIPTIATTAATTNVGGGESTSPTNNVVPTITPYDEPSSCVQSLVLADTNSDNFISSDEYLDFVRILGCPDLPYLTSQLESAFQGLTCFCMFSEGLTCCLLNTQAINILGARIPEKERNPNAIFRLTSICFVSVNVITVLGGCNFPREDGTPAPMAVPTKPVPVPKPIPVPAPTPTVIPVIPQTCIDNIIKSDENVDNKLNADEFFQLVQYMKKCDTWSIDNHPYKFAFFGFCSLCLGQPNCCNPPALTVASARINASDRTDAQTKWLNVICGMFIPDVSCPGQQTPTAPAPTAIITTRRPIVYQPPVVVPQPVDQPVPYAVPVPNPDPIPVPIPFTSNQPVRVTSNQPVRATTNQPISNPDEPTISIPTTGRPVDVIPDPTTAVPVSEPNTATSKPVRVSEPSLPVPNVPANTACEGMMMKADQNNDYTLDTSEYLSLIQDWSNCNTLYVMSKNQIAVFYMLACKCPDGRSYTCCSEQNDRFSIDVFRIPYSTRTESQIQHINDMCASIAKGIEPYCTVVTAAPTESLPANNIQPSNPVDGGDVVPPIVPRSSPGSCAAALVKADIDSNNLLDIDEFLQFVVTYSSCDQFTILTNDQETVFFELACLCLQIPGSSPNCCQRRNAGIDISGATQESAARTNEQMQNLDLICTTINTVIPGVCAQPTPSIPILSPSVDPPSLASPISLDDPKYVTISPDGTPIPPFGSLTSYPVGIAPSLEQLSPPDATVTPEFPISTVPEACVEALLECDEDSDGYISSNEFAKFLRKYSGCELITELSPQQETTFMLLAATCVNKDRQFTCLQDPKFSIEGADQPNDSRTPAQLHILSTACAGSDPSDNSECNASPTTAPLVYIPLDSCRNILVQADANNDQLLDVKEYLVFVREMNDCPNMRTLDIGYQIMFQSLACSCLETTSNVDCCVPSNARLNISGANSSDDSRSTEQTSVLTKICSTTEGMKGKCDPAPTLPAERGDVCVDNLAAADANNDSHLDSHEFLSFVKRQYEACKDVVSLSFAHRIVFNLLSCFCVKEEGATLECCNPLNAKLNIGGAFVPASKRTPDQSNTLTWVCAATNATINSSCRITPPSFSGVDSGTDGSTDNVILRSNAPTLVVTVSAFLLLLVSSLSMCT